MDKRTQSLSPTVRVLENYLRACRLLVDTHVERTDQGNWLLSSTIKLISPSGEILTEGQSEQYRGPNGEYIRE